MVPSAGAPPPVASPPGGAPGGRYALASHRGTTSIGKGARVSSIAGDLARLSGPVAYLAVAALVFGETAVFLGFVIPGETAVVLGGVLASRGRVSLPLPMLGVVFSKP